MSFYNDNSRGTLYKLKMYGLFGLCGLDGYVETSEKHGGHCQLRAWEIFSCFKVLTKKRTTSGMAKDGIFQSTSY